MNNSNLANIKSPVSAKTDASCFKWLQISSIYHSFMKSNLFSFIFRSSSAIFRHNHHPNPNSGRNAKCLVKDKEKDIIKDSKKGPVRIRTCPDHLMNKEAGKSTTGVKGTRIGRREDHIAFINSEEKMKLLRCIGKGSFGTIYLAKTSKAMIENNVSVLKCVCKRKVLAMNQIGNILQERRILEDVCHPFIVKMYGAFQSDTHFHFELEFCAGGDLYFHMTKYKRFPLKAMKFYAVELILALQYLHSKRIIYRDLKPENVVLDMNGHARIVDFGLAKPGMEGGCTYTICGSHDYIAPEILLHGGYSFPVDFWALGCVLYELVIGLPPFFSHRGSKSDTFQRILCGKFRLPAKMDTPYKTLLNGLLCSDPAKRFGEGLRDQPVFQDIDWGATYELKLQPPIKPKLQNYTDTTYFDVEFTNMAPSIRSSFQFEWETMEDLSKIQNDFPIKKNFLQQ